MPSTIAHSVPNRIYAGVDCFFLLVCGRSVKVRVRRLIRQASAYVRMSNFRMSVVFLCSSGAAAAARRAHSNFPHDTHDVHKMRLFARFGPPGTVRYTRMTYLSLDTHARTPKIKIKRLLIVSLVYRIVWPTFVLRHLGADVCTSEAVC